MLSGSRPLGRLHELNFIFPFRISDESERIKVDFRHQRHTEIQIKRQILSQLDKKGPEEMTPLLKEKSQV